MITTGAAILDSFEQGRWVDATRQLDALREVVVGNGAGASDILDFLGRARLVAIAQRAHLLAALQDLDSSQLYISLPEPQPSTWQIDA